MIVCNEERIIRSSLSALQSAGFRSFTLLDTGSTDNTVQIARETILADVSVMSIPRQSLLDIGYGALRNICASFAAMRWLLFVDADEILSGGVESGTITIEGGGGDIFAVKRSNRIGGDSVDRPTELLFRLYRPSFCVQWQGYIHEEVRSLAGSSTDGAISSLLFDHYSGLYSESSSEKEGRYSLMMLRAYKYPHLRIGTNSWWYDDFVPREKHNLLRNARAYALKRKIDAGSFDPDI